MKILTLKISGMHCKSCAMLIEDSLKDLGVKTSFKGDVLSASFDEKKISESEIKKAIKKEGYGVK